MIPRAWCLYSYLLLLTCRLFYGQTAPQPGELLKAANAASDLSAIGPYKLEATITWGQGTRDQKSGALAIFQDQDRLRWELRAEKYAEVTVVLGTKLYNARTEPVRPKGLYEVASDRLPWRIPAIPRENLRAPFALTIEGVSANCVAAIFKEETERYCFEASTGRLIQHAVTERGKAAGKVLREKRFLDYQEIEGKVYPRIIRRLDSRGGKPTLEIENTKITRGQMGPTVFAIPTNANEFETCADLQEAKIEKRVEPEYPLMAKVAHIQGETVFVAVIGVDGRLQNIRVVSGHPILIQSAMDAIRQWKYSPAMCGDRPVAVETELRVEYRM